MSEPRRTLSQRLRHSPLFQLALARLRESYREPEALFWVYGFPIILVVALGIAFRNRPIERVPVDVEQGTAAATLAEWLGADEHLEVTVVDAQAAGDRLRRGKTNLIVRAESDPSDVEYAFDPTRPDNLMARKLADDAIQRGAGRADPVAVREVEVDQPGGRYVNFLVPGLVGMSLMGGGLWGVGFLTVDLRIRKLLKRFLATPMKRRDFLAGIMLSRLVFIAQEMMVILLFSRIAFGVENHGSIAVTILLIIIGAATFSGVGLLVASRAKTLEAVSGLMNVVMLPQWIFSGIFFSSERFPDWAQPAIKVLPLTPLIDALRAVMLDGDSLQSVLGEIALLVAWGVVTFVLALRWFRWT